MSQSPDAEGCGAVAGRSWKRLGSGERTETGDGGGFLASLGDIAHSIANVGQLSLILAV